MDEVIFDVILQTTGAFIPDIHTIQMHPRPETDFFLGDEFWVGSPPKNVDPEVILRACDPAHLNFDSARQYGMLYAFCHCVQPGHGKYYDWDSSRKISRAIFLSRLIHPTTIANRYSARLYFDGQNLQKVVAGPTQALGAHAWIVAKHDWRDWLSILELEQLRGLWPVYEGGPPDRVRRARRHLEASFHTYYLDQRFALLVASFESLLKTYKNHASKQFESRAPKLAEMLGYELTGTEAKKVYSDRSAFVHGSEVSFNELDDEIIDQYNRFEQVIRAALLRASTEPEFAQRFSSPESIEKHFGTQ